MRTSTGRHRLPRVTAIATSRPPCTVDVNVDVRGAGTALHRCTFITDAERVCVHCMATTTVRVYRRAPAVCGDHSASVSGTRPHHLRTLPHLPEAPRSAVPQCMQRQGGGERGTRLTPLSRTPSMLSQTMV